MLAGGSPGIGKSTLTTMALGLLHGYAALLMTAALAVMAYNRAAN